MKAILKFIDYYVSGLYFVAVVIFSVLSGGDDGKNKRALLLFVAGMVLAAIYKPAVFFAVIIIYLILVLAFIIIVFWTDKQSEKRTESKEQSGDKAEEKTGYNAGGKAGERSTGREKQDIPPIRGMKRGLFDGMTMNEAKKEYRRLMKQVHPDNAGGGDPEMAKKISEAYNNYRKRVGR